MRWLGHITRREETYVGKRMRQMVVGRRKRGRPKRRWQDCIDDDLKGLGVREEDALDRREWRRIIPHRRPQRLGIKP